MARQQLINVLSFWRDTEFFIPFDLDALVEFNEHSLPILYNEPCLLPWEQPALFPLDPEREYGYDFYFAAFAKRAALTAFERVFPEVRREVFIEPRDYSGLSCCARISIGDRGTWLSGDISLSTLPWALSRLCRGETLQLCDFDTYAENYLMTLQSAYGRESNPDGDLGGEGNEEVDPDATAPVLTHGDLVNFAAPLIQDSELQYFPEGLCGILVPYALRKKKASQPKEEPGSPAGEPCHCEEKPVRPTTPPPADSISDILRRKRKVDILNSFYLRDLERVARVLFNKKSNISPPLKAYLPTKAQENHKGQRVDILADAARDTLISALSIERIPLGRWPAADGELLGLNQQLVVNRYLEGREALLAANGPPGTGKTTLVRDLVAALVTERAGVLAKLEKPADAFRMGTQVVQIGRRGYNFRELVPELTGFEIVVASNNNAAVENISKALPKRESLAAEYQGICYLTPIAKLLCAMAKGEEGLEQSLSSPDADMFWGLPSVALGNATNRHRFRKAAFTRTKKENPKIAKLRLESGALTFFEYRKKAPANAPSFRQAQHNYKQALNKLNAYREGIRDSERDHPLYRTDTSLRSAAVQLRAPWLDPLFNQLRSLLFISALQLQEAWIRETPRLEGELLAISALLGSPQALSGHDALELWHLLFMLVPVVSTTLASVERMFAPLEAASLGHVIIDEAGQATPQSAAGLLLRAKRALIIGDQRQLEPIAVLPRYLERQLGAELSPDVLRITSPLSGSVQSLADRQSLEGTYLESEHTRIWLGRPLCVHRRCVEPMFSIANAIAYNGMMVQATPPPTQLPLLGPSCWFQIKGGTTDKQWVPEQGKLCRNLLFKLLAQSDELPDVFFISPFRVVKQELRTYLSAALKSRSYPPHIRAELRTRIGTVHTFQGKEADILFLVLGCDFSRSGAAEWAGEKPNLLNVAVTRARHALYVVGDVDVWHNRGYFSDLEKALPKRRVDSTDVF